MQKNGHLGIIFHIGFTFHNLCYMKQTGKVTALKHLSSLFTLYMQAVVTETKLITSEMKKV